MLNLSTDLEGLGKNTLILQLANNSLLFTFGDVSLTHHCFSSLQQDLRNAKS